MFKKVDATTLIVAFTKGDQLLDSSVADSPVLLES